MTQFKTGWRGKTRDGRDARVIADDLRGDYPLVVVITDKDRNELVVSYAANGRSYVHAKAASPHDLIDEPLLLEGWVNLYPGVIGSVFPTKEEADRMAVRNRIACVHVRTSYHVGDGL